MNRVVEVFLLQVRLMDGSWQDYSRVNRHEDERINGAVLLELKPQTRVVSMRVEHRKCTMCGGAGVTSNRDEYVKTCGGCGGAGERTEFVEI